jgi:hypothetical protein
MTSISIPVSLPEAQAALTSIDGLITAREWERAAIVYAFTHDGAPGSHWAEKRSEITTLSSRDFAALGISGLRSDQTVRRHRKAWQDAIDQGKAQVAVPGYSVQLPDLPWGEIYVSDRASKDRTGSIEIPVTGDARMGDWFSQHPEHAQRVANAATSALTQAQRAALADDLADTLHPDQQAQLVDRWMTNPAVASSALEDPQARARLAEAQHARHREAQARVNDPGTASGQVRQNFDTRIEVLELLQRLAQVNISATKLAGLGKILPGEVEMLVDSAQRVEPVISWLRQLKPDQATISDEAAAWLESLS